MPKRCQIPDIATIIRATKARLRFTPIEPGKAHAGAAAFEIVLDDQLFPDALHPCPAAVVAAPNESIDWPSPERLKRGRKFPHVASQNRQEATAWRKDGSLVVTIDSMLDGAGRSVEATRTVLLGLDAQGKPRIVKSTIKYETARE